MTKRRKYLKDLIPININSLVLETGYFEVQIGDTLLSYNPERHPNGCYYVCLFRNHLRQRETWELSARSHSGRLQNGGHIPYRNDEVYYVVSHGRRYRHLFIDPETLMVGTRTDFFPQPWAAYPRGKAKQENKNFHDQCREMENELFQERDEFLRDYEARKKLSHFDS
jgi:hypothetical protein